MTTQKQLAEYRRQSRSSLTKMSAMANDLAVVLRFCKTTREMDNGQTVKELVDDSYRRILREWERLDACERLWAHANAQIGEGGDRP